MLFSGKITNSFIVFLNQQGVDLERLYELTELPTEFLQDSSCWLEAAQVENFIKAVEKEFAAKFSDKEYIITQVGHSCHRLRAWGVLDSVLKMMQKPQDIYLQPQRFISYFVSPAPPIGNLVREEESISFDLPISHTEFPLVAEYLRAALEALPGYVGKEFAAAQWKQTKIKISWSEAQATFLNEQDLAVHVNPELMQSMVSSLEKAQLEIESLKRELLLKESEVRKLKETPAEAHQDVNSGPGGSDFLRGHVLRMSDYFARAQQLVTLLVKQDRMDRQVQEAMRRVDWDFVKVQYRHIVEESLNWLESSKAKSKSKRPAAGHAFKDSDLGSDRRLDC